jgi:hypothetical protein
MSGNDPRHSLNVNTQAVGSIIVSVFALAAVFLASARIFFGEIGRTVEAWQAMRKKIRGEASAATDGEAPTSADPEVEEIGSDP